MSDLLTLDPSSSRTGFAYFRGGTLAECGAFTPNRKRDEPLDRIRAMCEDAEEFLCQFDPDEIVIEMVSGNTAYGNKTKRSTLAVQCWACGAIWRSVETASGMSCAIHGVSEVTWTRGRNKADRQQEITVLYPGIYDASKDRGGDVSDAIGLGLWWMDQCREIAST